MIRKKAIILFIIIFCIFIVGGPTILAQESNELKLSLSPPLIKNNVSPGQVWQSSIRVANNNTKEIKIYVQVLDFTSGEETGTVQFLPSSDEKQSDHLLSKWIKIGEQAVDIPPLESREIPFVIDVPETAEPGGHYAAILAGTRPPEGEISGSAIKVASLLTTLLLINVGGDIREDGRIREFTTGQSVYQKPQADFNVRFENLGNVHIQPHGEIKIYDMFNQETGRIMINRDSEYGNVLPGSIRKWNFEWRRDGKIWDMGRYRAELLLSYGEIAHATTTQILYFWVINYKLLGVVFAGLILLILFIVISLRLYIKRTIKRAQKSIGYTDPGRAAVKERKPIESAADSTIDLTAAGGSTAEMLPKKFGWRFFRNFTVVILSLAIIAAAGLVYRHIRADKGSEGIDYESSATKINDNNPDPAADKVSLPENETADVEETASSSPAAPTESGTEDGERTNGEETAGEVIVTILNGSGRSGSANNAALKIRDQGYKVAKVGNADSFDHKNTIIQYAGQFSKSADELKEILGGTAELVPQDNGGNDIIVIIGQDYAQNNGF